jgi:deazaflavin-dependent oxidoreductase (nitroreductase family)
MVKLLSCKIIRKEQVLHIRKQRQVPFFYSVVNPILHFLIIQFGLGTRGDQDVLRILRVRGRKSGRTYVMPVRIAKLDGQRYVISMLGESPWARNLRAVGGGLLRAGRNIESVHAEEIVGQEKATFLTWYCQYPEFAQRARYALKAGTDQLTPAEIDRLCRLWPVFRLEREQP